MTSRPRSSGTPPRHREMWGESHPPYQYDHDASSPPYPPPSHAPPPPYYGTLGRGGPPPTDYWSYEHPPPAHRWGAPPPPYESGYDHRSYPPPPMRNSRAPPGAVRSPRSFAPGGPEDDHHRIPISPRVKYYRGPAPGQPKTLAAGPPPPKTEAAPTQEQQVENQGNEGESPGKEEKKKDALSLLANVTAGMSKDGKKKQQQQEGEQGGEDDKPPSGHTHPIPAPTSPLQRRQRPSPITPSQVSSPDHRMAPPRAHAPPEVTPTGAGGRDQPPPPTPWGEEGYPQGSFPPNEYPHQGTPPTYHTPRRRPPGRQDFGPPSYHEGTPALVERGGSFDSVGEGSPHSPYGRDYPPRGSYYYEEQGGYHGPPPSGYGGGYWDAPPSHPQSPYPPPRWGQPNYESEYHSPPTPHQQGPGTPYMEDEYHYNQHRYPPSYPPPHASPYTYVQQPRLEEKTVLKKKFSWKHYPVLEKYLIANRDEYLRHSSMNYTAEQKQYNNWLTEQLISLADKNGIVFDRDDFGFVNIRDRIRCYYKSYVQTARKRGIKLPKKEEA